MIIIDDFPQLDPRWFAARLGNPGASNFDKIVSNVRGTPSKSADGYAMKLAGEIISGVAEKNHITRDMEIGIEREPRARKVFAWEMDMDVREVALCYPDGNKKYHCSPDGLTSDGGGLEIKCPKMQTHMKYLLNGEFPASDYNAQVQGSLLVTGLPHWWFMSYYPDLPPFIVKVMPDEDYMERLSEELEEFCLKLLMIVNKIRRKSDEK